MYGNEVWPQLTWVEGLGVRIYGLGLQGSGVFIQHVVLVLPHI